MMKKIWALVLAVVMVMAMSVTAFAADMDTDSNGDPTDNSGVIGAFTAADTAIVQTKTVTLYKEITGYNQNTEQVYAPTVTYKYTVSAGSAGKTVADDGSKVIPHNPAQSVSVTTKAGVVVGLKVAGGSAGTTSENPYGTIGWTNSDKLDASATGEVNVKSFTLDFTNVIFSEAGIYRYMITEDLNGAMTYANTGVTETSDAAKGHTRYLDVYVKPATAGLDDDNDNIVGDEATDWEIYGYVCFYNDESITAENATTVPVKTTGFVSGTTNGTTEVKADSYYTYDLTISKDVENDEFAKAMHSFPFTVIFGNNSITNNIALFTEVGSGVSNSFAVSGTAPTWSGVIKIKDIDGTEEKTALDGTTTDTINKNSITYIGIPAGVDVEVYETNDVNGVTYSVKTTRTGAANTTATDNSVLFTSDAPTTAVAQVGYTAWTMTGSKTNNYESTKTLFDTTAVTASTAAADVTTAISAKSAAVENTLLLISPTGVVLRVAPYVMILVAGIALLILAKKRKPAKDEE